MAMLVRRCLALLLILLAAAMPGEVSAAKNKQNNFQNTLTTPMKVIIVRSSDKACEPYCPEWIMAEGMITSQTPAIFIDVFLRAKARAGGGNLPVVLKSAGGNIVAAIQIGYYLRNKGANIAVGSTDYQGCSPLRDNCVLPNVEDGIYRGRLNARQGYCLSACPLILAAGQKRLANPAALIGVHHWGYQLDKPGGKTKDVSMSTADKKVWDKVVGKMINDYLAAVGHSQALFDDMLKAPFTSLYLLNRKRRSELALISEAQSPNGLIGTSSCKEPPRPTYCVLIGASDAYKNSLLMTQIASDKPAMTVTVVRDSRRECEPACQQWIGASGVIRPETPRLFLQAFKRAGRARLPVLVDSPGGDLDAALEIGRMIRERGLDVVVGGIEYEGCVFGGRPCGKPDRNGLSRGAPKGRWDGCAGVCTLVLAAGKQRVLPAGFDLPVYNPNLYISRLNAPMSARRVGDYLIEMGAGTPLMENLKQIRPGNARRNMPGEQARDLALATTLDGTGFTLAPATACRAGPPLAHCVKRH